MKKKYLLFLIIAILFVVVFSYTTTWGLESTDQSMFMTMGWMWKNGKIPYIDFFDHKGPFIFFINMLGFIFTNKFYGIMILQIIFMFINIVILYSITKLFNIKGIKNYIIIGISLLSLSTIYSGGNLTEEWCLPFILISFYYILKYLKNYEKDKSIEHNKWYAFIYGMSFAICLLTRVTNAIGICCGILVIGLLMIVNKQYKNIVFNILFFILGFIIIFLPFSLYFIYHNAFNEFIYGMILYSIKYATNSDSSWLSEGLKIKNIKEYIKFFMCGYILILPLIINFKNMKINIKVLYILLILSSQYLFLANRLYPHYAIIALPYMTIALCELLNRKFDKKVIICLILFSLLITKISFSTNYGSYKAKINSEDKYSKIISKLPVEYKENFIAYNINTNIYLNNQILPKYKYFMYQDWHASNSNIFKKKLFALYSKCDAKYILFSGNYKDSVITPILEDNYILVESKEENNIYLFELSE